MYLQVFTSLLLFGTLHAIPNDWMREHPDGVNMTTPELIEMQGYPVEVHHVTTTDWYILELHRIPHGLSDTYYPGKKVVFVQHCLLCSSADFVMNYPEECLAYILADAGYDVWMGNYRGNTYSRNHTSLDPDSDKDFWQFSWDEMGLVDLPAMIDFVLEETAQDDLYYVGFSMGTTTLFVMLSERPEYNDKLRVAAAMGPAAHMENMKGAITYLAPFSSDIDKMFYLIGHGEVLPSRDEVDELMAVFCDEEVSTSQICYDFLFMIGGSDPYLLNEEYLPVILAHTPAGTSYHTVNHYAQLFLNGGFTKYDYGKIGNNNHYGQDFPPEFNLTKVVAPIGLYWGPNDYLAAPEDVVTLAEQLPNVIVNHRVDFDYFSHLDFVWATQAKELVYDYVLETLAKY